MKATGVVRRIDELVRIVIPKEIRKTLRIREGENIEIYLDSDESIVLKKYSIVKKLGDFAQAFTDSIYSFLKLNILITDNDNIIAFSGPLKKEYINKSISDYLLNSIKRRENILEKHFKSINIINEKELEGTYTINSIIVNGDVVGLFIIFSDNDKIKEVEEKISQIAAQFLSKYLES